jgi:hypothetical protein
MSLRPNAPYQDRVENDGSTIVYEGHDVPQSVQNPNPKLLDQPELTPRGSLTENGKFHKAAQEFKAGLQDTEKVRVYEKIGKGIWSYNGLFQLVDSWRENSGERLVFKFKLVAIDEEVVFGTPYVEGEQRRRVIPTHVKLQVWKRDGGKCAICGATNELHFDHIIPFSKGGTSLVADNVQLLCARHNLQKRDKIE